MDASPRRAMMAENAGAGALIREAHENGNTGPSMIAKVKVYVAAENRLLRESLVRMLTKKGVAEICGTEERGCEAEEIAKEQPEILLLASRGIVAEDLEMIRKVRASAPMVRILLVGMDGREGEFLQCVRAGINGYLRRDASSSELLKAVTAVCAGEAVCPGELCAALFRYFEKEAAGLPCASAKRRLGLTRREQQLIPLLAQGLTNKEIANHFSLSEQTVKNHVYRMKRKIGADDRLDIVHVYRTHGYFA